MLHAGYKAATPTPNTNLAQRKSLTDLTMKMCSDSYAYAANSVGVSLAATRCYLRFCLAFGHEPCVQGVGLCEANIIFLDNNPCFFRKKSVDNF